MIPIVIASLLLSHVFGKPPTVGRELTGIQEQPWLASIQIDGYHKCAGSIITKSVILTAAHCVADASVGFSIVRVGSSRTDSDGSWHDIAEITSHAEYRPSGGPVLYQNDVALIRVTPSLKFGVNVSSILLASSETVAVAGSTVGISGWKSVVYNSLSVYELKNAKLRIIDRATCARAYGDMRINFDDLICASQYDGISCHGDPGGPLVQAGVQIGIVSSGGCDHPLYPGVYTSVARHRQWIETNARLMSTEELSYPEPIDDQTFAIPSIWGTRR